MRDKVRLAKLLVFTLAFFEMLVLARGISKEKEYRYDDTNDYEYVATELRAHHWNVLWTNKRPAGFPMFLIATQALGVRPNVAAAALNPWGAVAALFIVPPAMVVSTIALAFVYLLLNASAMLLTYQNSILTESVLPFFLIIGWALGIRARVRWREGNYRAWSAWTMLECFWLLLLKPAFKALVVFEIFWVLATSNPKIRWRKWRAWAPWVAAAAALPLLLNATLLKGSGGHGIVEINQSVLMSSEPMPELTATEEVAVDPELNRSYRIVLKCQQDHSAKCFIAPEKGAELYRAMLQNHFFYYLELNLRKMGRLIYYSTWGEDYGHTHYRVGIPKGFGFLGMLCWAALLGLGFHFGFGKKTEPALDVLGTVACSIFSPFGVQYWMLSSDLGRLSLPWVIPAFALLAFLWWKTWHVLLNPRRQWLKI